MSTINNLMATTARKATDVRNKLRGDSQIVVALVLIAVAVGLCIIFRDSINNIMNGLFTTINTSITKLAGTFNG